MNRVAASEVPFRGGSRCGLSRGSRSRGDPPTLLARPGKDAQFDANRADSGRSVRAGGPRRVGARHRSERGELNAIHAGGCLVRASTAQVRSRVPTVARW